MTARDEGNESIPLFATPLRARKSTVVRLRAGVNTLIVMTHRSEHSITWGFGVAMVGRNGEVQTDLSYY